MKLRNKVLIGITLVSAILLVIGLAIAQPPVGTNVQALPFESRPSTYTETGSTGLTNGPSMIDGILASSGLFFMGDQYTGMVADIVFSGFGGPKATPSWTIGWVDIRIKYQVPSHADDQYSWEYTTDGATWITLVSKNSDPFDSATPAAAQVRAWSQVLPNDGTWDWTDVGSLQIRVSLDPAGWIDYAYMSVFDVWISVYQPPLPPSTSTTISIQPPAIAALPAGPPFFVEVYAQDVTGLAGYQITVKFNTTVLMPMSLGWSYYPFTDVATAVFDDLGGYVSLAYTIPISDPQVTTGVTGNVALARIYFSDTTTEVDYSWLLFNVTLLGDPAAGRIAHTEYHGLYGTAPPNTYIIGSQDWPSASPESSFPYDGPITTEWVEIYPEPGVQWHLSSWDDNGDFTLDPSDQIDMTMLEPPTGEVWWFHVEEIWESFTDPNFNVYMIVTFKYKEVPEFPLGLGIVMMLAPLVPVVYLLRNRKKVTK